MKSLLIYASQHHGNTEKLVRYLAAQYDLTLVNAQETTQVDMEDYDLIGFASGIDFGRLYPSVSALAEQLPSGKAVYVMYTCARDQERYGKEIQKLAEKKGSRYLGKYACKGYNTYGPWKMIGGMNKGHPDEKELQAACVFYEQMRSEAKNT